jgi:PAS domain-containing protein
MPLSTLIWLAGPFVLLCFIVVLAVRRSAQRREAFDAARARGRHSEAGLASAMSEAITRMRGQELANQARYAALDGFFRQVLETLPQGVFVLGPDGNLRVANAQALEWLGLTASVEGQVLWTLEGTERLRSVAQECLHADARRDASLVGPGAPGAAVRVTAVPLRSAGGDPEGVLYVVDVEHVS